MSGKIFINRKNLPSKVLYVGVDVGKFKHCARATTSMGRDTKWLYFSQGRSGFESFVRQVGKWCSRFNCDVVEVGLEPTGNYWKPLYSYLRSLGFTVKLVPPFYVRCEKNKLDNSPLKSDEKDALLIARLLGEGSVVKYSLPPARVDEVRRLVKELEFLDREKVRFINRLESYVSEYFPELDKIFGNLNCVTVRAFLRRYPFPVRVAEAGFEEVRRFLWEASRGQVGEAKARRLYDAACSSVGVAGNFSAEMGLDLTLKYLEMFERDQRGLKRALGDVLREIPACGILRSIPGVGDMTAASVVAYLGDLRSYNNNRQVLKKAGLNLYHISSGLRRGGKHISKRGSGYLRKMLYMASTFHTRRGGSFYDLYERLLSRGARPKEALVAIMRKILKVAYALVRDGRMFDENYPCNVRAEWDQKPLLRTRAA